MKKLLVATTLLALTFAARAEADVILYVDDTSGNIGQVDVTTGAVIAGSVHSTGLSLTDIGFGASGTLYGTTFTNLYSINPLTGASSNLGTYNVGGGGMNALVGTGSGNTLLAASNASTNIYTVNPGSPGTSTTFATSPLASAGDLASAGSVLYEAGIAGPVDALVDVNTGTDMTFHVGSTGGSTLSGVFGLADNGTTMYAVDGTEVYSVNLSNAVLSPLFSYAGAGLGSANGTAFIGETTPVPEPASLALLGVGLVAFGVKRRKTAQ